MKIDCLHGYYKFSEIRAGEVSLFRTLTSFDLVLVEGEFIFQALIDAPKYSIAGGTYFGAPCVKTFAGEPWEIMEKNGLVFDFIKGQVVPILTIVEPVEILSSNNYLISNGMIKAGSLTDEGLRVTDYAAHYLFDSGKFNYSEVNFV